MRVFSSIVLSAACLSVAAQSGFQEFMTTGVFTVPPGVTQVFIEAVGAGGNGGFNGTGGGGGGGYASGVYAVTPLDIIYITVGTGGGGAATGTTHAGGFVSASGGENGVSVPNPEIGGGGNGGTGSGGNISNFTGGKGGGGYYTYFGGGGGGAAGPAGNGSDGGNTIAWTGICLTPGGDGGLSGGAPGGNGGKGAGFIDAICSVSDPSAGGSTYGGGGGGGNGNGGGPGNGSGGYVKISWCAVDVSTTLTDETITATATGVSYQWIDCGTGMVIPGATEQSFTATVSGSYAVLVTDAVCSDTTDCVDVTVPVTGIYSSDSENWIVYPNPFTEYFIISGTDGDEWYTLTDATGRICYSSNIIVNKDFRKLAKGIFYLTISTIQKRFVQYLIKE